MAGKAQNLVTKRFECVLPPFKEVGKTHMYKEMLKIIARHERSLSHKVTYSTTWIIHDMLYGNDGFFTAIQPATKITIERL